jgi:hypothetical protein
MDPCQASGRVGPIVGAVARLAKRKNASAPRQNVAFRREGAKRPQSSCRDEGRRRLPSALCLKVPEEFATPKAAPGLGFLRSTNHSEAFKRLPVCVVRCVFIPNMLWASLNVSASVFCVGAERHGVWRHGQQGGCDPSRCGALGRAGFAYLILFTKGDESACGFKEAARLHDRKEAERWLRTHDDMSNA